MKKFYRCEICGNLVGLIDDSGVTPDCCGQPMTQLTPNSSDGAGEKHVPVCEVLLDPKKELDTRSFFMQIGGGAENANGINMQIGKGRNVRGIDIQIGQDREHEKEALVDWLPVKLQVQVGAEPHPMTTAHYIQWIIVETDQGTYKKELHPDDDPKAIFFLCPSEDVKTVYALCNIHGLYVNENCDK